MTRGVGPGARHGDAGLVIGREGLEPIRRFVDPAGGNPFLIWYAPFLPHAPHTPPDELLQKYVRVAPAEPVARYWACVEWFDRTCGDLLELLDRRGLRENTIVIYTCDNGWIQDPARRNRFAPRSKLTPYEGGIRTPIMISWPGQVVPRLDREHLASSIDIWPTLAALVGTPTPDGLPGIDLTDSEAVARRRRVFGGHYAHNVADVDDPTRSLRHRWVIDGWWKLIAPAKPDPGGPPQLYDLRHDPWEQHDLASQEPDRVEQLARQLESWWTPDHRQSTGPDRSSE